MQQRVHSSDIQGTITNLKHYGLVSQTKIEAYSWTTSILNRESPLRVLFSTQIGLIWVWETGFRGPNLTLHSQRSVTTSGDVLGGGGVAKGHAQYQQLNQNSYRETNRTIWNGFWMYRLFFNQYIIAQVHIHKYNYWSRVIGIKLDL